MVMQTRGDLTVALDSKGIAVVEIHRAPNNFFDAKLIRWLAEAYEELDAEPAARAIVLCAEGKHFCAGANFARSTDVLTDEDDPNLDLYTEAVRMMEAKLPVVAAIQGAAIGGGLGVACSADFRVGCPEARLASNFAQLGFHHGFGLTVTLPPIVGQQKALDMLFTGRRVSGEEAASIGLLDRLVAFEDVRSEAILLAEEIASSAPLSVRGIRATMRQGLAEAFCAATDREREEQNRLQATDDFKEGIKASTERRPPSFKGS
jgi:2-(1,2-epoxy-1,2-dihydrophenyl)acetyl-CoA isomerase